MGEICLSGKRGGRACYLDKLKLGESAIVLSVKSSNKLMERRLFEMGLTKGIQIKIKKIAPLGDPVSVELRGYELCLRKQELKNIEVKIL